MSDDFFRKIHVAIAAGPLHGEVAPRPDLTAGRFFDRHMGEEDRIKLLMERAVSCGSTAHRVGSAPQVAAIVQSVVPAGSTVLIDPLLPSAGELMRTLGGAFVVGALETAGEDALFDAAAVLTAVDFAIAETGSVVIAARDQRPRLASTVAAIHFALVRPGQIVADLMDLPERFGQAFDGTIPGGVTVISGPSKTADIEMNLVIGVHGPGQMHLIVLPE